MATIRDVAKRAGVSIATVSRVVNSSDGVSEETLRRVQEAIQALNFQPDFLARSWRTRTTRTIAAVVRDSRPHHGLALQRAGAVALDHDYSLLLCTTYSNAEIERRYLEGLRQRQVDGLLITTVGEADEEIRKFTEQGVPVVLMNRPLRDLGPLVDSVYVDSYRGSLDLVEHLIRLGHRHIAFVYEDTMHSFHTGERLRGYRDALARNDLPFDPNLVRSTRLASDDEATLPTADLVFSPRPTVVYAASYAVGLASLATFRAQGLRVPEDIAFVTFDDIPGAAFMDPPLTLVRNPAEDLGRVAAELVFERLADPKRPTQEIKLQPSLVVRRSCGWPGLRPQ